MDRMARLAKCATRNDLNSLARLLAVTFRNDPVFDWLSRTGDDRPAALERFFQWLLAERAISYGEVWMMDGAIAVWLPPGADSSPGGFVEQLKLLPMFLKLCGMSRLLRGAALADALEKNHPHEPHYYLAFLAVAPEYQGRGLGSALLEYTLARVDAAGMPAYLENSNPRNTPLYNRFGFSGRSNIAPKGAPPMLAMWRNG